MMMSPDAMRSRPWALLLISLFLLPVLATAQGEDGELQLQVELQIPDRGFLIAGDEFTFSTSILNTGDSTATVNTNPSCPVSFTLLIEEVVLYDSYLEDGCRDQNRGAEIEAFQNLDLGEMNHTLAEITQAGKLELRISAPSSSMSKSIFVDVQKQYTVPETLTLEAIIAETPSGDGIYDEMESLEVLIRYVNNGSQVIEIPQDDDCRLRMQIEGMSGQLTEIRCDGGLTTMRGYSIVDIGWLSIDATLIDGQHELILGLPAQADLDTTLDFEYFNSGVSTFEQLNASIQTNEVEYNSGDTMTLSAVISNYGEDDAELSFSSTCRAEIHILDKNAKVVYDTRDLRECPDMNVDHLIKSGESLVIEHADWTFFDRQGCELESGVYRMVVDVPEFDVRGYSSFIFMSDGSDVECFDEGTISLNISDLDDNGQGELIFSTSLIGADEGELRWAQPCRLTTNLYDENTGWPVMQITQSCGEEIGLRQRLLDSQKIDYENMSLAMVDQNFEPLSEGTYRLEVSTNSWPSSSNQLIFDWPLEETQEETEQSQEETSEDMEISESGAIVHGSWQYVTTEIGGCWLFTDMLGRESVLSDSSAVGMQWMPKSSIAGNYSLVILEESHPSCQQYPSSFILLEIVDEYEVQNEDDTTELVTIEETASIIEEYGADVLTGVATVSISAMLILFITTHEGLRLPLTGLSLTLLGLIGRTHETNDGKFQRGRLMGYLTANPGCHFRALLGALQMSNGQLTHHIKVLEDEERIWRRPDGRLMRFYPSNISITTPDDELPIPPLSPDPNSLQGKILKLLDDDGQMGTYPTQSDLAVRLEKSQQLVSHHLRTLQKFGLVERKKFGMRNRYKLTREALFLLESNDL